MDPLNSAKNTEIINIPKSILKISKINNKQLLIELKNLLLAQDINFQQKHLNLLIKSIKCEQERVFVTNVLSYMFLKLDSKLPVRKSLIRTLLSSSKIMTTTCLASHITIMIEECNNNNIKDDINIKKANNIIIQLNMCFSNFPAGLEALTITIDPVFIISSYVFLKSYFFAKDFQERQPYIYNSSKLLVSLLSQLNAVSKYISHYGLKIMNAGFNILSDESLDFNTRSNCSILLCLVVIQLTVKNKENNAPNTLLKSCSTYTAKRYMISGIVKTFHPRDLCGDIETFVEFFVSLVQNSTKVVGNPREIIEVNKTFLDLSKLFIQAKKEHLEIIFKPALNYIWAHLDHFIDSVKLDTITAFKNFVKIAVSHEKTGCDTFIKLILEALFSMLLNDCINHKILLVVAAETSCEYLLGAIRNLPQILLQTLITSTDPQLVCSVYEQLMQMYSKEQPEKWVDVWVKNLVHVVSFNNNVSSLKQYQNIFETSAKIDVSVINLLKNFENNVCYLTVFTSIFITVRKLNPNFDSTPIGNYFWKVLFKILIHNQSDEIRVLVPRLLVESHKTTEIYPEKHLKWLREFLYYNLTVQSPSFRQEMIAMYKKGFVRYKESLYVIRRNINSLKNKLKENKNEKLNSHMEVALNQEKYYMDFMNKIVESHLKIGLLSDVNNYRRSVCLEMLVFLRECIGEEEFNLFFDNQSVLLLYDALIDSFESNINMASKLLLGFPSSIAFFQSDNELLTQIKRSIVMTKSIKPNSTLSGSYLLRVYKNAPNAAKIFQEILQDKNIQTDCSFLLLLKILIKEIRAGISVAKHNIHKASKFTPVYGLLLCIRHFVEKEHFELEHPNVIPEIIDVCLELSTIVSPIVNSSSPEGYLPQNNGEIVDETSTSQMILLYAWRTSKEISLLLGELNLIFNTGAEIIPVKYLEKIAYYFTTLFMETKHRGAYEQAYVGFSKFCSKLWQTRVSGWTIKLLESILQVLGGKDVSFQKICPTRRSAGVPFIIQAILATEHKSRCHKSLHMCMEKLLKLAQDTTTDNIKAATHSMNILRALFKHNHLGDYVLNYVSRGAMIAINGFSNVNWSIRNASTLLLSSLMTRIFGVQRTKDDENICIKNRMSAKVFFMRYQELYEFMLKQFKELKSIDDNCLYPLLLILSRLYSCHENSFYEEYYQHIFKCLGTSIYKIRELAAQSFVSIIPKHMYENIILTTFRSLNENDPINLLHGKLLQIKAILTNWPLYKFNFNLNLLQDSFWILKNNHLKYSPVSSFVYIEIILILFFKMKSDGLTTLTEEVGMNLISSLGEFNGNTIREFPSSTEFEIGKVAISLYLTANICSITVNEKSNVIKKLLFIVLTCCNEDLQIFAANCLKYIFLGLCRNIFSYKEEETDQLAFVLINFFDKSLIFNLITILSQDRSYIDLLRNLLMNMNTKNKTFTLKLFLLLPFFGEAYRNILIKTYNVTKQETLDYLINLCCDSDSDVFIAVLPVICMFVKTYKNNLNYDSLVLKLLKHFSDNERSEEERLNVACFLVENYNFMYDENILKLESRVQVWYIVLKLLQDDDEVVRDRMSKITNSLLTITKENRNPNIYIIAEKSFEELLQYLPQLLNKKEALKIYLKLSLQYTNEGVNLETQEIFDKGPLNAYKENLTISSQARKYLKRSLWTLDDNNLNYEDFSILIEEHALMVATKLYNLFSVFLLGHNNGHTNKDVLLAMAVLREIINYLEEQPIDGKHFKSNLVKFLNERILPHVIEKSNLIITMSTLEYVFNLDSKC